MFDVVVVGGGPAGLSGALMLGRCRRSATVIDAGSPRNARSRAVHGFLTRDGIAPADLLRIARDDVARYGIEIRAGTVTDARRDGEGFAVSTDAGECLRARKLLLATGVVDCLPSIDGFAECYGTSVFHCPYCDGWEVRDQPLAVYARGRRGVGLATALQTWSSDVVLCSDGPARLRRDDADTLRSRGIGLRQEPIARLAHAAGQLHQIVFGSGAAIARRALFFNTGQYTRSSLAERLGCQFTNRGAVRTDDFGSTCVPGVYVAGDASRDVQLVAIAAAEGAKVAYAINVALQKEPRG